MDGELVDPVVGLCHLLVAELRLLPEIVIDIGQDILHPVVVVRTLTGVVVRQEGVHIVPVHYHNHGPRSEEGQGELLHPGVPLVMKEGALHIVQGGQGAEALTHWHLVVQEAVLTAAVRVRDHTHTLPDHLEADLFGLVKVGIEMILEIVDREAVVHFDGSLLCYYLLLSCLALRVPVLKILLQ